MKSKADDNPPMAVSLPTVPATVPPSAVRRPSRRSAGLASGKFAGANPVSRCVAILVYDGVTLLDVVGPAEVFNVANRFGADYRIVLLSPTGEDVMSNLGFKVAVGGAVSSERAPDTFLVAGSDGYPRTPVSRRPGGRRAGARSRSPPHRVDLHRGIHPCRCRPPRRQACDYALEGHTRARRPMPDVPRRTRCDLRP